MGEGIKKYFSMMIAVVINFLYAVHSNKILSDVYIQNSATDMSITR